MTGWSIEHAGRRFWAATKADARKVAQAIADQTGISVTVRPVKPKPAAKKPAKRVMRRNPDPGSYLDFFVARDRAASARRDYLAATKGRRLAKSLRGQNRGGSVKASEAAARKSGKFSLDVKGSINGVKQAFTLYRASRSAADALARQMEAAGYKVRIQEI